jgi:hypothetical protein
MQRARFQQRPLRFTTHDKQRRSAMTFVRSNRSTTTTTAPAPVGGGKDWSARSRFAGAPGGAAALAALLSCASVFAGPGNDYCVIHNFNITTNGNVAPQVRFTYNVYAHARTNSCKDLDKDKDTIDVGAGLTSKTAFAWAPNSSADAESLVDVTTLVPGNAAGKIEVNGNADPDWDGCPWGATRGFGRSTAYSAAAVKVRGQKVDRRGNIKYSGNWKHVPPVVGGTSRGVSKDPIIATLIDNTTGITLKWVLFNMKTTSSDGEIAWNAGSLSSSSTNMDLHIKVGDPAVTLQSGELKIKVQNGIVTELVQLGLFSAMPLPAVGSPGGFSVPFPELSLDYDMGGDESHDLVPELDFDNAGEVEKDVAAESLGTCVTDLATGYDGSMVSMTPDGDGLLGVNTNVMTFHIADDFRIPMGSPVFLDAISLPLYELGGPGELPFEGAFVRIWQGEPGAGGAPIAGDMVTNRLIATDFTEMYRVSPFDEQSPQRALKEILVDLSWMPPLPPGQYYAELAARAQQPNLPAYAPTVPWASESDNALGYDVQTEQWMPIHDNLSGRRVAFPIHVHGIGLGVTPCPADIDGNGFINIDDLLAVINQWGWTGQPGSNPADINNSGNINIDDLLGVINQWGQCQHGNG